MPLSIYFSHTWNDNRSYEDLTALLAARPDFEYRPYGLSPDHPVHVTANERKLYETIKNKMKFCDAVLLLCGVYSTYSRWVNKELIACKDELHKPLIAVQRYDPRRTSAIVKENADLLVPWYADEIVDAIRKLVKP